MSAAPTQLLEAAVNVLARQGPAALTVRAVAKQAGCSTTGIYTHFGGKHGLVDAIAVDGLIDLKRSLSPGFQAGDPVSIGVAYRLWALANPTHYLLVFGRAIPGYQPGPNPRWRAARLFAVLCRALAGRGATEPRMTALHLLAVAHGQVMLELVDMNPPTGHRPAERYETGLRLALSGLDPASGRRGREELYATH